jgi:DNA-binding transcriptional MerR regulator
MHYTVKTLAKASGVSVRTLHYYDEIGLLKPAFYGENHYRYYETEQLLTLQQVLFFRELDIPLNEIQEILSRDNFDKVEALFSHKHILKQKLNRMQMLIKTIDITIAHLKGKMIMNDIEMYEGFDLNKQQEYEKYLLDQGILTEKEVHESWKNVKYWKKEDWEKFHQEGDALNKALALAIKANFLPESTEVQSLIRRHYEWVKCFWTPTKTSYVGLGEMYLAYPDFRQYYDAYHPKLANYLVAGMKLFAERELDE